MGVRRRLLRYLLDQTKYIRNLSEQQFRASLWRGEATFYKIELEPRLIQELLLDIWPLCLEVLEVHIDEFTVKIPWSQLMTQSTLLVAHNINIKCEVRCEDEKEWREVVGPMMRRVVTMTREMVNRAPTSLSSTFTSANSALDQLTLRMVDGLQIQVGHIKCSFWSRHWRHFPGGLGEPGKNMKDESEEILVAVADDLLLSPCDEGKVPSDKMRSMAVYDQDARALQCTKLLKIGSLRISPPSKPVIDEESQDSSSEVRSSNDAEEFMDAPTVLSCFIIIRSPSDGYRLCPFPFSTQCLIDLPNPLNVTLSEEQLQALFALLADIGQMETWRLDDSLLKVGESEDKSPMMAGTDCHLINTSNVSRTIALGEQAQPKSKAKPTRPVSAESKRSPPGLAGGIWQKVWRQPEDKKSGSHLAPGFHPVDVPDLEDLTRMSSVESAGSTGSGDRPDEACSDAKETVSTRSRTLSEDQDPQNEAEMQEVYEEGMDFEEDDDFVSVASDEDGEWATKPAQSSHWEKMKNWFGGRSSRSDDLEPWPEINNFHSVLQFTVASLSVQIQSLVDDPGASVDLEIDRFIWRTENWVNYTNVQNECVRRLKASAEGARNEFDMPGSVFVGPLALPTFMDGWANMTWHRGSLWYGKPGEEISLVQSLEGKSTRDILTLTLRPRDAPCEILPEMECPGQRVLKNWPLDIQVCHANVALEVPVFETLIQAWQRLLPFLQPKIPPDVLISPNVADAMELVKADTSSDRKPSDNLEMFPGDFMRIELQDCEVFEPDEAALITSEQRWPLRISAPRVFLRSNSDRWDFSQTVPASQPTPALGSTASPITQYATPLCLSPRISSGQNLAGMADIDGTVAIPKEMFDQLVAKAAEATQKEAQVMAAREELQRAYISLAAANAKDKHGAPHVHNSGPSVDSLQPKLNDPPTSLEAENERLRRRNTQLESSLQAATLAQRRLEAELAHHQAHAQDSLSKFLLKAAKAKSKADANSAHEAMVRRAFG